MYRLEDAEARTAGRHHPSSWPIKAWRCSSFRTRTAACYHARQQDSDLPRSRHAKLVLSYRATRTVNTSHNLLFFLYPCFMETAAYSMMVVPLRLGGVSGELRSS